MLVSSHGLLVVTVPNDFSQLQMRALSLGLLDNDFWVVSPDHINCFNTTNIQKIAKHTGWSMLDMLADFPIDWFLMNDRSNYIQNPELGKSAHNARLEMEILISENSDKDANTFYRALANLGMGRNLKVILTPNK